MDEKESYALIPHQSGAVAKLGAGPKSILDGMVSDALAVVRDQERAIAAKKFRVNFTPADEKKYLGYIVDLFDGSFQLGYHKFKDSAKCVLDFVTERLGISIADQITLKDLQTGYLSLKNCQESDTEKTVMEIRDKAAIEKHTAQKDKQINQSQYHIETNNQNMKIDTDGTVLKSVFSNHLTPKCDTLFESDVKVFVNQYTETSNAGLDPDLITAGIVLCGFYLEAGMHRLDDVTKTIASELETPIEKLSKYLPVWFNGARYVLERKGFDVSKIDIIPI